MAGMTFFEAACFYFRFYLHVMCKLHQGVLTAGQSKYLFLRMKEERPRHAVHCDYIRAVAENVSIPVIAKSVPAHISEL